MQEVTTVDNTEVLAARPVAQLLADGRQSVEPVLHAAVDRLPASMRRIVNYHFGWCDEHGEPVDIGSGKAIRPTLVLLAARAVAGSRTGAIPARRDSQDKWPDIPAAGWHNQDTLAAACAVELVHNFSLLHDDVMDGDLTRRHRRTAWSVFGSSAAILAGDALLTLAMDVIARTGHPEAAEATSLLSGAVQSLVDGQSADVSFEQRHEVTLVECLDMASNKTAALFGCCCALGALHGGGSRTQVAALRSFGTRLGLAFQFVDDLLGIWGDEASTGKPVHSDVDNRKKSLPVVAALTSETAAGRELATLYKADRPLSAAELARAAELIESAGGRQWCSQRTEELLDEALRDLDRASPHPETAADLTALSRLMVARDH